MRTILLALALLAIAVPVGADHCLAYSTSAPELTLDASPVTTYYWDNDLCQPCMWSTWVYEESNGIPGLQREDEVVDDTCHGMIAGDTIIF